MKESSVFPHNHQSYWEVRPSGASYTQILQKRNNDSVCTPWYIMTFISYQKSFLSKCLSDGRQKCHRLGTKPDILTEAASGAALWASGRALSSRWITFLACTSRYLNQTDTKVLCNDSIIQCGSNVQKLKRIIPYTAQNTANNFLTGSWESLFHPALSLDIVPNDLHFWITEDTLWTKNFQHDEEMKPMMNV
jgi:hypothetical protein